MKHRIDFRISPARTSGNGSGLSWQIFCPRSFGSVFLLARRVSPGVFGRLRNFEGQKEEMASTFIERGLTMESSKEKKGWSACFQEA